jgi:hypothetical protein
VVTKVHRTVSSAIAIGGAANAAWVLAWPRTTIDGIQIALLLSVFPIFFVGIIISRLGIHANGFLDSFNISFRTDERARRNSGGSNRAAPAVGAAAGMVLLLYGVSQGADVVRTPTGYAKSDSSGSHPISRGDYLHAAHAGPIALAGGVLVFSCMSLYLNAASPAWSARRSADTGRSVGD